MLNYNNDNTLKDSVTTLPSLQILFLLNCNWTAWSRTFVIWNWINCTVQHRKLLLLLGSADRAENISRGSYLGSLLAHW
jgi:hypothetical protein